MNTALSRLTVTDLPSCQRRKKRCHRQGAVTKVTGVSISRLPLIHHSPSLIYFLSSSFPVVIPYEQILICSGNFSRLFHWKYSVLIGENTFLAPLPFPPRVSSTSTEKNGHWRKPDKNDIIITKWWGRQKHCTWSEHKQILSLAANPALTLGLTRPFWTMIGNKGSGPAATEPPHIKHQNLYLKI